MGKMPGWEARHRVFQPLPGMARIGHIGAMSRSKNPKQNPYQKKYSRRELFQSLVGRGRRDAVGPAPGVDGSVSKGDSHLARGEFAEAVRCYRAYLERFPDHLPTRRRLVLSLYKAKRLPEARAELEAMLGEGAGESFARLYLGLVLARSGSREEALAAWKRYRNIDQPLILRAVNLLLGREEIGEGDAAEEMVAEVEAAIEAQQQADSG